MVAKKAKGVALKLPKAVAPKAAAGPQDGKRKREASDSGRNTDTRPSGDKQKGAGKGAGKAKGKTISTNENFMAQKSKGEGKGKGKERSRNARRSKEKKNREKEEKALPKKKRKRLEKKKKIQAEQVAKRAGKKDEAPPEEPRAEEHADKKQEHADKPRKKVKASAVADAQCRKGHNMLKRTENPAGYSKPACCDKCGMANLCKKVTYFYHCSFCKWDVCPNCILSYRLEGKRAPKHIRERIKEEKEGGNGKIAARAKKKDDQRLGLEIENAQFTKERREIWLPTDANAVSRAPTNNEVISDWVEGMPV